jgi:two-component sensor histidine kinase
MQAETVFKKIMHVGSQFTKQSEQADARNDGGSYTDLLLAESDHRFKNNLQMMISIVRAAQRATNSGDVQSALESVVRKFQALSQVEATLRRARSEQTRRADELLRELCESISAASPEKFELNLQCDAIDLPNEFARPFALIVNELLTNAIKYGLTSTSKKIFVGLKAAPECIELRVEDNGIGIDRALLARSKSGLRTVRCLVRQLDGYVDVGPGPGGQIAVRFNSPHRSGLAAK